MSDSNKTNDPLPLMRIMEKGKPFPVELLPPVMQGAILKVHDAVQAPLEMICQSFLAAATLAVQPYVDICIDGRQSPCSNNFIAIGVSGERKTAVDRYAIAPIKEKQKNESDAFKANYYQHEAEIASWNAKWKELSTRNPGDEVGYTELGEKPKFVEPLYICSEPTFQAIEKAFAEGRYTLGLFSDEGGRFLGGFAMKSENQINTITGLSKLWDGDPLDRLRVGDGKNSPLTVLYGRRFSVHLMLQPELSNQLFSNQILSGQGFLSRCLCCYPESTIGERMYKEVNLQQEAAIREYNESMSQIRALPVPMNSQKEMGLTPKILELEREAKTAWIHFHDFVEQQLRPDSEFHSIIGFACKSAEHAARIAGVLTYFRTPEATTIDSDSMTAGIEISKFYLYEALRLFHSALDDPMLALAEKCFQYGMEKTKGIIELRNLYQYGPNAVRTKEVASKVMEILVAHGRAAKIDGFACIDGKKFRNTWELIPLND